MKKQCIFLLCAGFLIGLCGCQTNKTRVAEGVGIGGAIGALAGGIIGHQSGHGVEGAVLGGVIGAGAGAAAGSQIEKPMDYPAEIAPLTMQQIVDLTKQGVSSDGIINKIKSTGSKFALTQEDIAYLQQQKVSQRVIEAMQGL